MQDEAAGGFSDSSVRIYDLEALSAARALPPEEQDGAGMHVLYGHSDAVYSVSFSQDRQYLLSASSDGTIRFWSVDLLANLTSYRCEPCCQPRCLTSILKKLRLSGLQRA